MSVDLCEHCGESHAEEHRYCPATGKLIASRLLPPDTLLEGKYRIGRTLGVGGMGAVFEATHMMLDKRVAVKVMLSHDEQMMARLVREARAASATGHPNIATVTDMGWAAENTPFVVMEFLDGVTLKDLLEDGPLPPERAVELTRQALAGLDVVHKKGIIHRDLKPENLMVVTSDDDEELVKILDFGISKVVSSDPAVKDLTSTGLVMGTPNYMSPEQARGSGEVTQATDIYAMGAILFAMLTGRPPHEAETLAALIAAKLTEDIAAPSTLNPAVPTALDQVVLRALARDPEQRFGRAREFRQALQALGQAAPTPAAAAAPPAAAPPAAAPPAAAAAVDPLDALPELVTLDEATSPDLPQADAAVVADRPSDYAPPPASSPAPATEPTAPQSAPAPQQTEDDHRFRPPDAEEEMDLELVQDPLGTSVSASSTSSPALAVTASGMHRAVGGQARRKPQRRLGLYIALLAAAALSAGGWWLYERHAESARAAAAAAARNARRQVKIFINPTPQWAEIRVDGVLQSTQPLYLRRSQQQYSIEVRAQGYYSHTMSFRPERDMAIDIALKPRSKVEPKKKKKRKKRRRRRRRRRRRPSKRPAKPAKPAK